MNEEIQMFIDDAEESMKNAISHLEKVLVKIRAGKASPGLLNDLMIDYYGTNTLLSQIANINTPDARTIRVQPWEKNMIGIVEKTILTANLGFNPSNNGESIIINVPPLTEERRKDLVKQIHNEGEDAKISIRNIRRDTNDELKKLKKNGLSEDEEKNGQDVVQNLTNKYIKLIEEQIAIKEKDILTV